jgi:GT2 family glycosyltransferase
LDLVRSSVIAVVLTYRRPHLATQVVTDLLEAEKLDPSQVVLVVNGEGGLDDPELEKSIAVISLPQNLGPAGGFAYAMRHAIEVSRAPWIYMCEDDQRSNQLPTPRLADLIEETRRFEREVPGPPIGGVLASAMDVDMRMGGTHRLVIRSPEARFQEVDYGPWWGALVSRDVVTAGLFPDEKLFWWAEDLEYWLRVRAAGFRVIVDLAAHKASRNKGVSDESWCAYYMARNQFHLRRRHGSFRWTLFHILKTVRRFQLAPSRQHRVAIVRGFVDGLRGRTGRNPSFSR